MLNMTRSDLAHVLYEPAETENGALRGSLPNIVGAGRLCA
jgi:hypothetical protein